MVLFRTSLINSPDSNATHIAQVYDWIMTCILTKKFPSVSSSSSDEVATSAAERVTNEMEHCLELISKEDETENSDNTLPVRISTFIFFRFSYFLEKIPRYDS